MPTKSTTSTVKPTRRTSAKSATKRKTTTAKTTAKAKTTRPTASAPTKPARKTPAAAKVAPKLVEVKEPVLSQPELRKKELIDLAVTRSGLKKKDVKPAIEAALQVLGEALADGRELNMQPLGKLKIQRREEKSNGTVMVCRLRQPRREDKPIPEIKAAE